MKEEQERAKSSRRRFLRRAPVDNNVWTPLLDAGARLETRSAAAACGAEQMGIGLAPVRPSPAESWSRSAIDDAERRASRCRRRLPAVSAMRAVRRLRAVGRRARARRSRSCQATPTRRAAARATSMQRGRS